MIIGVFTKENESEDKNFRDLIKELSNRIFEIGYAAGKAGLDEEIAKSMNSSVMEVLITAAIKQTKSEKKTCIT